MTLIVILNSVLALMIVGVIVGLHARAIVKDHLHHGGHPSTLWAVTERPIASAPTTPEYWPARRPTRVARPGRRQALSAAR